MTTGQPVRRLFTDYSPAVRATFTPTRDGDTYVLSQVDTHFDAVERGLLRARTEITEILDALRDFHDAGDDATRAQAVKAFHAAAGLARDARVSGGVHSEIAGVTAKAGFLQAVVETGLITEKEA